MDDTDRKLLIFVGANPRIHFHELARRLGISRQAVHHRMQALTKLGVIKGTIAGLSVSYLDAVPMAVFGPSKAHSVDETLDRLGTSEFTRRVVVAGGNYLYVVGFLRDISELDGYVEFVRRAAEMPEPCVGIYCLDEGLLPYYSVDGQGTRKKDHMKLSSLDLKIIACLRDNARRPVSDMAKIVGATPKTVRRHLNEMVSDGSLDMSMPVDLTMGGDMFLIVHVNLKGAVDRREFGKRLLSKQYFQDQYLTTHSNNPSLVIWVFWSDNIAEIRRAASEVGRDSEVLSVMLNFAYLERIYPTWRDRLLEAQVDLHNAMKGVPRPLSR